MSTNNDLNQQRTVTSHTGAGVTRNSNMPTSPNNQTRNHQGSGANSPVNNIPGQNKEPKN